MNKRLFFFRIPRSELIAALLGEMPGSDRESDYFDRHLGKEELTLVYESGYNSAGQRPISVVVADDSIDDLFVWLDTYAPQFTPISQTCRVFRVSDDEFLTDSQRPSKERVLARAYAGLVVGELIAQSGGDPFKTLDNAGLALAQSTLSFAYGRNHLLWGTQRQRGFSLSSAFYMLERHALLPARRLGVDKLNLVWQMLDGEPTMSARAPGIMKCIHRAIGQLHKEQSLRPDVLIDLARYYEPARVLISLEQMTAEERVLAFDRLLASDAAEYGSDPIAQAFCAAYAAVEIGGGTTRHMNLLVGLAEHNPLVWPLFGLLSSIGGTEKWHALFARLGRLVERELSYSFDITDPPRADLSWQELESYFLTSPKRLALLPRAQQRTLSVELVPGVSLHLPLSSAAGEKKNDAPIQTSLLGPKVDLVQLDEALASLWSFRQSMVKQGFASDDKPSYEEVSKKRNSKQSKKKSDKLP